VAIPEDLRPRILFSSQELEQELLPMTDRYTDQIFALPPEEAATILFPVSRLILDPERFIDDAQEPMAAVGMGVIYTRGSRGQTLREPPSHEERSELLARFYAPHHEALSNAIEAAVSAWGHCLVIDCHSFPSRPLPYEPDQRPDRPDICLGTDAFHTPKWLAEIAEAVFGDDGFHVALNRPYAGALVPASHYHRDHRVLAIMVEVNRALYMDETNGDRLPEFKQFASRIQGLVRQTMRQTRSRVLAQE
jgi:N-formylglutamate amidohydrolase